ncbi:ProQ/FinO family protein (plasmid) [Pseudomonas silesiensis]|uniref:ProQ/FinO family protein n=1 Tax=Pseudomonas silesiensis TaxID=1853130 RepID=UPI0030CDC5B8
MSSITVARKTRWFNLMNTHLEVIQKLFPLAFPAKGEPVKPLKTKVSVDLVEALKESNPDITADHVQRVLGYWCSRRFYLKSFKEATHRIDLAGQPVEEVSEADRENAQKRRDAIDLQRATTEPPFTPPLS